VANRGRPSVNKRRKEAERRERKRAKAERLAARAAEKRLHPRGLDDSDLAHIVPGPQPLPEELRDLARREDDTEN
jgi:hypothetical protein